MQVPEGELQLSLVHTFWSSQLLGLPGLHDPPAQTSPTVQPFPSSQKAVLFVCTQVPEGALQLSSVHGFWSSQLLGLPGLHDPPAQTSPTVQPFPSSQKAVLFVCTHRPAPSQ
jgi:hypothetical protein